MGSGASRVGRRFSKHEPGTASANLAAAPPEPAADDDAGPQSSGGNANAFPDGTKADTLLAIYQGDSNSSNTQILQELATMAQVKQAVADAESSFTFEGLRNLLAASFKVSESELRQLFEEVDTDSDGLVTKEQFLDGLSATPSIGGLRGISGVLREAGVLELLAHEMLAALKRRIGLSGDDVDMATVLRQAKAGDVRDGLRAAEDAIVNAVAMDLNRMQGKPSANSAKSFNDKFANDDSTFEGVYLDVSEFRNGLEGALGLPGKDIYAGMEMEFCHSGDSQKIFSSSNYDISTTPEKEWAFVVSPDMAADSSKALRKPVPLKILLLACSARKANEGEERYDTSLEEMSETERDGVKSVLLRRVKEAGLTRSFLAAAAGSDARLRRLGQLDEKGMKQLRERLGAALHGTAANPATGHPAFAGVVAALEGEGGVSRAEAEGLVAAMRSKVAEAELDEEEVLALRLYSGPAFRKLNGSMRGMEEALHGNNYVATIFAAVSGMTKIAQISPIPAGRTVYRGQKGMRLPASFWQGNAQGVKGGVEMAFLSTTTSFKVACQYAAEGQLPTVFAIQVGAVDKGAALSFLSQFPDEEEILMPPRSFLEVVDEPSLVASDDGVGLVIPVKINCNLLCPTLAKLRESRKTMLVSTLEHMRKEIARDVDARIKSDEVKQRAKADIFWKYAARRKEFVASIKEESVRALAAVRAKPAARFLNDAHFRRTMQQALDVQRIAMGKLELWVQERKLYITHLTPLSAQDCERKAAGRIRRLIEDAEERMADGGAEGGGAEAEAERKQLVARLCKHLELIEDEAEVDEPVETSAGETSLMLAAAAGNAQAVELLLGAGADANRARADGITSLILAAQGGHGEVVKKLVQEGGADPDARDKVEGRTALIYGAENGHTATVAALLKECKADPAIAIGSGPQAGGDAAYRAAYFGFKSTLRTLVEEGGLDVGNPKENGWNALMAAAQNGHEVIVKWIVKEAGGDVNAANADGKTALMLAAQQGHSDIVRWLVEEGGADAAAVDKHGSNVLMAAAPKTLDAAMTRLLIQDGRIDPSAADKKGKTALMAAAGNGSEEVVEVLVQGGGAVEAVDREGYTALMMAAENGRVEVVRWLVTHGQADASARSERRGCTALTLAAEKGRVEVLEVLAAAGAEVGVRNQYGTTALMAAAGGQMRDAVEWLLAAPGVAADAQDGMGWTAVHYALYADDTELANTILSVSMRGEPDASRQARLASASADIATQLSKPLCVWAGLPWKAWVDAADRTVKFTAFTTIRFAACCPSPARAYYELEVLEPLVCPQLGFATSKFKAVQKRTGKGCGDDAHSWGIDGQRSCRYHNAKVGPYAVVWKVGDVIGLACDLTSKQILVSVNGDFSEPNGVMYNLKPQPSGDASDPLAELFATFTCLSGSLRYNLGEEGRAFTFQPPSQDFLPMARAMGGGGGK